MSARATTSYEDGVRDDKRNEVTLPAPTLYARQQAV